MAKLIRDPKLKHDYAKVITNYVNNDIVEVVKESELDERCYYLPHQAVLREDKDKTKTSAVFDASSHTTNEHSLYVTLYSSPCLLPLHYDVLLRFQIGKIGLVSDIKQAFLKIQDFEQHQDYLRFLWHINDDDEEPTVLRIKRVRFGINCGPFLLNGTIETHLMKLINEGIDPDILRKFLRHLYVDDSTTTVDDVDEGYLFYKKSKCHMGVANLDLCKWETNDSELRNLISQCEESTSTDDRPAVRKVLGLNWDTSHDRFILDFKNILFGC